MSGVNFFLPEMQDMQHVIQASSLNMPVGSVAGGHVLMPMSECDESMASTEVPDLAVKREAFERGERLVQQALQGSELDKRDLKKLFTCADGRPLRLAVYVRETAKQRAISQLVARHGAALIGEEKECQQSDVLSNAPSTASTIADESCKSGGNDNDKNDQIADVILVSQAELAALSVQTPELFQQPLHALDWAEACVDAKQVKSIKTLVHKYTFEFQLIALPPFRIAASWSAVQEPAAAALSGAMVVPAVPGEWVEQEDAQFAEFVLACMRSSLVAPKFDLFWRSFDFSQFQQPQIAAERRWYHLRDHFAQLLLSHEDVWEEYTNIYQQRWPGENEMAINRRSLSAEQTQSGEHVFPRRKSKRRKTAGPPWTNEEVVALIRGVNKFGAGQWKKILMHFFPEDTCRTNVNLKDKWRHMQKTKHPMLKKYYDVSAATDAKVSSRREVEARREQRAQNKGTRGRRSQADPAMDLSQALAAAAIDVALLDENTMMDMESASLPSLLGGHLSSLNDASFLSLMPPMQNTSSVPELTLSHLQQTAPTGGEPVMSSESSGGQAKNS
ncbi:MAG: hypothetical protein MHM6MM_004007 [Cercozoa sp. M6MM]